MEYKKSTEMPEPQTLNYTNFYKMSPMFISDLKKVLGDLAYVDVKKFFDKIDEHQGIFPIALLNEFIREIGRLPYKYVNGIMSVISNDDNFLKYFNPIPVEDVMKIDPELIGVKIEEQH